MPDAWDCALTINTDETLHALAEEALMLMELELAIRAFRRLGDACMVLSLETARATPGRHSPAPDGPKHRAGRGRLCIACVRQLHACLSAYP